MSYKLYIDWEATNWTDTPDFSQGIDDVSGYLKWLSFKRGVQTERGNVPAGTLQVRLRNNDGRFSPPNAASPLFGLMRPWLPVKLDKVVGASTYTCYTGFISRIHVDPHIDRAICTLYCTDGMDLLARQVARQQNNERTQGTDGAAIDELLNVGGWSSSCRSIDTDGGALVARPKTMVF